MVSVGSRKRLLVRRIRAMELPEMFEQILEAEQGRTDVGLRPVEKNAACAPNEQITGIHVEVS